MTNSEIVGRGWSYPVEPHRGGRIGLSAGYVDIDESISLILGTAPGERVMRPDFGCRIHELVFGPINPETTSLAQRYVEEALGWWEPRIEVLEVAVAPDAAAAELGKLLIYIVYRVKATKDERALVYPFYLIREE